MKDTKLGQPPEADAYRDAIHVAIAPVVAGEPLKPGDHVGLNEEGHAMRTVANSKLIGVVDPFLREVVTTGNRFWLCLYQQTVTGMRHVWSHPNFAEETTYTKGVSDTENTFDRGPSGPSDWHLD